jgi:hypothetical protein
VGHRWPTQHNLTVLHSVAVDKQEVLSTLVSNIGHEHNELAEFVRQLSQSTASADDVVELNTIVECIAGVTGVSEHKAEQLITEFIGREGVELEHLKREQQLVDDKIRELQLARDQMTNTHDSLYNNQLPYLKVAKKMQRECERYKHDLNSIADGLSERLNAKVAQAIQQLLVDKHQQNNIEQLGLPSTESQDTQLRQSVSTRSSSQMSSEMLQPVADDCSTVTEEAATAALKDIILLKRHQNAHKQVKDTAISSPPPSAEMPAVTGSTHTRLMRQDQLLDLNKPLQDVAVKSVSRSELLFEQVAEPLVVQQQIRLDYATRRHSIPGRCLEIKCVVVGHESAQTRRLIEAYVISRTRSIVTRTLDGVSFEVVDADKNETFYDLHVDNCTKATKLEQKNAYDFIVICFSVVDKVSYEDVGNVWLKQVKKVFPDLPYLLVGTQTDQRQRTDIENFQVEYEQGLQLCRDIGAVGYFECSGLDLEGVETIFKYAVQHVFGKRRHSIH